jgi:hypothetical protein
MVNPHYLSTSVLAQVRNAFHSNKDVPSVTLQKFFSEEEYKKLSRAMAKAAFRKTVDKMHYSYSTAKMPKAVKDAVNDTTAKKFISMVLNKEIKDINGKLCMFQWKDYTLLHDETVEKPGVDVILDFTPSWDEKAGGKIVYVDGSGNSHHIPASPNTLSVTMRNESVQKFVQYCNHYAGKRKHTLFFGAVEF